MKINIFRVVIFTYIFSLLLVSCDSGTAPINHEENTKISMLLDKMGDSITTKLITGGINHSVPGAVIGVISPETNFSYIKAFGKADIDKGTSLFRGDEIRIGTLTQTFIATLVFRLIDEGKILIDDAVNKYIQVPHSGSLITIRHLLSMRSGLADFTDSVKYYHQTEPQKKWTNNELLNFAFNADPLISPGQKTKISQTNYLILGMVIEKVTGEKLDVLMENRIFNVLNLSDTKFNINSSFHSSLFSRGYVYSDSTGYVDYTSKSDYSWAWSTANMTSVAGDMTDWAAAFGSGRLLSSKSLELMMNFENYKTENGLDYYYGMGMMKIGSFIGYTGEFDGYYTSLYYLPGRKTIIYVFTNSQNQNDNLIVSIARLLYPGLKVN